MPIWCRSVGVVVACGVLLLTHGCGDDSGDEPSGEACSGQVFSASNDGVEYCVIEGALSGECPDAYPNEADGGRGALVCGAEGSTGSGALDAEAQYWSGSEQDKAASAQCEAICTHLSACSFEAFDSASCFAACDEPDSQSDVDLDGLWSCLNSTSCGGGVVCLEGGTPPSEDELQSCILDNGYLSATDPSVPSDFIERCESIPEDVLCDPAHYMTEAGALCVAELWGLEEGIEPWRATLTFDTTSEGDLVRPTWSVSNTISRDGASAEGRGVAFDPNNGDFVGGSFWSEIP